MAEAVDPRRPARPVVPELLGLDRRAGHHDARDDRSHRANVRFRAMCFPFDAIVPDLPPGFHVIAGGAAGERLTLTSADGTEFSAYLARAEGSTGVVVLPDVRGLFRFYEQLAERFAAAGHPAIAIDYFGRTAGLGPRDENFEFRPHVAADAPGDRRAGRRGRDRRARRRARDHRRLLLRRRAVVHAGRRRPRPARRRRRLLRLTRSARASAGRSTARPRPRSRCSACSPATTRTSRADQVQAFDDALPVEHEIVTYEGAPHSFFDRRQEALPERIPGRVGAHPGIHL